ncbi:hypothetical protein BJ912DRAFT_928387 [Pholiota molesta]|nr:hypothetical protein BJ912DRAFT_928387 [Pholiota molesta]
MGRGKDEQTNGARTPRDTQAHPKTACHLELALEPPPIITARSLHAQHRPTTVSVTSAPPHTIAPPQDRTHRPLPPSSSPTESHIDPATSLTSDIVHGNAPCQRAHRMGSWRAVRSGHMYSASEARRKRRSERCLTCVKATARGMSVGTTADAARRTPIRSEDHISHAPNDLGQVTKTKPRTNSAPAGVGGALCIGAVGTLAQCHPLFHAVLSNRVRSLHIVILPSSFFRQHPAGLCAELGGCEAAFESERAVRVRQGEWGGNPEGGRGRVEDGRGKYLSLWLSYTSSFVVRSSELRAASDGIYGLNMKSRGELEVAHGQIRASAEIETPKTSDARTDSALSGPPHSIFQPEIPRNMTASTYPSAPHARVVHHIPGLAGGTPTKLDVPGVDSSNGVGE